MGWCAAYISSTTEFVFPTSSTMFTSSWVHLAAPLHPNLHNSAALDFFQEDLVIDNTNGALPHRDNAALSLTEALAPEDARIRSYQVMSLFREII